MSASRIILLIRDSPREEWPSFKQMPNLQKVSIPSTFRKLGQHTITPIFHMSTLYPHFIPNITSGALYRSGPAFRVFWASPLSADPKSERTGSPPVGHLNRREAYTILSPTCLRGEGFSSSCLTKLSRTDLSSKFNKILLALMSKRVHVNGLTAFRSLE
jgi:hypothetical protein